jgi:hypothetical protein
MKKIFPVSFFILISFPLSIYLQSDISKIVDFSKSPIKTFKESCSGCHGSEGSAYGKNFAVMSDDSLKEIISMMMYGPGQLTPTQEDIGAMVAYNKAISSKKPFAIVMNSKSFLDGKEDNLLVSLSPKEKLSVNDKQVKIEKSDSDYKLFFDPKKIKELKITVSEDNSSSVINFPKELWSE